MPEGISSSLIEDLSVIEQLINIYMYQLLLINKDYSIKLLVINQNILESIINFNTSSNKSRCQMAENR